MRQCRLCGESLEGRRNRRSHERFCSSACETFAAQIVGILKGNQLKGCASFHEVVELMLWEDARSGLNRFAWLAIDPGEEAARAERRRQRNRETTAALRTARYQEYGNVLLADPCAYCGAPSAHIDHIEPAVEGGANDWTNYTGACRSCNSSKGARKLILWLSFRPPLPSVRNLA